jgi:predicted nucleotide-binding protein
VNAELTDSIFNNILSTMTGTDFGVFLYSPVDVKARDNVVFESGLFIGMKKADHAIILLPKNYSVEPSDLHGILVMTSLPRIKDNQRRNTRNRLRGRGNL